MSTRTTTKQEVRPVPLRLVTVDGKRVSDVPVICPDGKMRVMRFERVE